MFRLGRGENLGKFGDEGCAEGAARDDDGEGEPCLAGEGIVEEEVGGAESTNDGENGGNPDEGCEGLLEVEVVGFLIFSGSKSIINIVSEDGGHDAEDTHDENPYKHWDLVFGRDSHEDEGDKGHAGDAVGLEAVGGGSNRVAGIVAGAVSDDAGVARIVLANLEDHLHEVASDIGNLSEDTAGDAKGRGTEALADGEADEAAAGNITIHEEQDDEHQHQLNADEHDADGHTGTQRDIQQVERTTAQRGESHAGVGVGVHADTEPSHTVAAEDTDDGPRENQ